MALVIDSRYHIVEILEQRGRGILYKTYDSEQHVYVALKTMNDVTDPAAVQLFNREWQTLANVAHANIVEVLHAGEFEEGGQKKPYFIMPLLPGNTLDKLIRDGGDKLTVERVIGILTQTCRGLQAAHASGLIHRDLKPCNLFVLNDDSVKIMDFGIMRPADTSGSAINLAGMLQYMSPEQLELREVTSATDIFSLGVVAYEALAGRKPFDRGSERAVAEAIRREFPPPVSELNPSVNKALAQVIAKAMAKNPWNRFANAREFADSLERAAKGEAMEEFEAARIQPRIERARKALASGDFEFADEILNELRSAGRVDPEIQVLVEQVKAASRARSVRLLLENARTRLKQEEFPLAWQKIQEVLHRDPGNLEAHALQAELETLRNDQQVDRWRRLVQEHLDNHAFTQARQALEEIRKIRPDDPRIPGLEQLADEGQVEDWLNQINDLLLSNEYRRALEVADAALKQFPRDQTLRMLRRRADAEPPAHLSMVRAPPGGEWPPDQEDTADRSVVEPAPTAKIGSPSAIADPKNSSISLGRSEEVQAAPGALLDTVHFTITAPAGLQPGDSFELYFWLHTSKQRRTVIQRAIIAVRGHRQEDILIKPGPPVPMLRGSIVSIDIAIQNLSVEPRTKEVMWTGDVGCAIFVVSAPMQASGRSCAGMASIRVNGCLIARMDFLLKIRKASGGRRQIPATVHRYSTAFASYASEDRDAVLARIQGISSIAPWMNVFVDVIKLRSGQYWEKEIQSAIRSSDVFYLFWCRHACASKWVEQEWRCALKTRGLDFIDPIPLEFTPDAPPPPELASKHFADPILRFIKAAGHS